MFENLNIKGTVWGSVKRFLEEKHPDLVQEYMQIYSKDSFYWEIFEEEIKEYCEKEKPDCRMYFHH